MTTPKYLSTGFVIVGLSQIRENHNHLSAKKKKTLITKGEYTEDFKPLSLSHQKAIPLTGSTCLSVLPKLSFDKFSLEGEPFMSSPDKQSSAVGTLKSCQGEAELPTHIPLLRFKEGKQRRKSLHQKSHTVIRVNFFPLHAGGEDTYRKFERVLWKKMQFKRQSSEQVFALAS